MVKVYVPGAAPCALQHTWAVAGFDPATSMLAPGSTVATLDDSVNDCALSGSVIAASKQNEASPQIDSAYAAVCSAEPARLLMSPDVGSGLLLVQSYTTKRMSRTTEPVSSPALL